MKKFLLTALLFAVVLTLPTQADFFQCPPDCEGADNADIINGSPADDDIDGGFGNDLIFGGPGRDILAGEEDNDLIFGGLDSDVIFGDEGDDTILPGPDEALDTQASIGGEGNDTFFIFAGETVNCQAVSGNEGFDVLHLIGFGPFIVEFPFSVDTPINASAIVIQDPITGGYIFIDVDQNTMDIVERINGLNTPNVTLLENTAATELINQNCIIENS